MTHVLPNDADRARNLTLHKLSPACLGARQAEESFMGTSITVALRSTPSEYQIMLSK